MASWEHLAYIERKTNVLRLWREFYTISIKSRQVFLKTLIGVLKRKPNNNNTLQETKQTKATTVGQLFCFCLIENI